MSHEKHYQKIFNSLSKEEYERLLLRNKDVVLTHQKGTRKGPLLIRQKTLPPISLQIFPSVFTPQGMVAEQMARWILRQNICFQNKTVLDIFCGCGIQGIASILAGTGRITFSDIQKDSLKNVRINVQGNTLKIPVKYLQSNLFSKIPEGNFDIILANYPFFSSEKKPMDSHKNAISSRNGDVIKKFFQVAHDYLSPNGMIICPYWWGAGLENAPSERIRNSKTLHLIQTIDLPDDIPNAIHKKNSLFIIGRKNN